MDGAPSLFTSADGKCNSGHFQVIEARLVIFAELVNTAPKKMEVYRVIEVGYPGGTPP
jgi:hypothetical protein